jgi:hypothetical protein
MSSFYKLSVAIIAVATCFSLTSCNNVFYQVYGIESNLNQNDNSLVFENEDCKVMYNLWSENGSLSFIFMNKTDKDIFINMGQTFYIKNGAANDYFKNRTYESRTISSTSNGFSISQSYTTPSGLWTTRYNVPSTISSFTKIISGSSNGVSTQEPQYICIPAKAYKVIDGFKIGIDVTYACNRVKDFPHDNVVVATYDQSTSPLKFENRITYSFSEDSNGAKYINNSFWLSNIRNYAEKAAIESINEKNNCYSINKTIHKQFKIGGPNKFYNTYNDKNIID